MKISGVIFDLDGTAIQSEGQWAKAFRKVLKDIGIKALQRYPQIGGIGVEANWLMFQKKYNLSAKYDINELSNKTYQEFIELIPNVTLTNGFSKLVADLKENGIKVALATSTEDWIVEKIFDILPIENLFDSVTTGEEVVDKKPKPEIFLKAAEKLDLKPEECVVVEDAASGVKAAHAAGMKVVALGPLKGADMVVTDFSKVSSSLLTSL